MKYQISYVSTHQTSKVLAIMAVVITTPLAALGIIGMFFSGNSINKEFVVALTLFLLMPICYGFIAYCFNRFFCSLYNVVAKKVGGIEVQLKDDPQAK